MSTAATWLKVQPCGPARPSLRSVVTFATEAALPCTRRAVRGARGQQVREGGPSNLCGVTATPAVGPAAAAPAGFRLDPGRSHVLELVGDTWRSRNLIAALARKNFYVQYRRASLGMAWAGLLPL